MYAKNVKRYFEIRNKCLTLIYKNNYTIVLAMAWNNCLPRQRYIENANEVDNN